MTPARDATERWQLLAVGAVATAAMAAAGRAARSPVMGDLQELAATAVAPRGSAAGEMVGVALQLVNGGFFAQLYELAFERLSIRPGWRSGLGLGLIHGTAAGVMLAALPAVHPRVPEQVPSPGAFLGRRGPGAASALVALHGLFGAIVGAAIARRRSPRRGVGS